jgi:superfamily II RNA helicase
MLTGDASINKDAPIICCTAEILANMGVRDGARAVADYVVMDEFHYYSDRDRGVAWQLPLLTMPQSTFVLMSATLGDMDFLKGEIEGFTGREVALVKTRERPVPLEFEYRETPIHETLEELIATNRAPVYVVHFTQRATAESAQNLTSLNFTTKEDKQRIKDELKDFKFDSTYGKDMRRYVQHGIGLHHAGLLPKYRLVVERLSQMGLLKVICGTDTLGVGVNIPIRTVLFTQLCKYDGEKTGVLSVRDFHQIGGRAGRKGFDDKGWVVAQAPEHVIENLKMEMKFAADPKKKKKFVKKKPPDRGYVHFDAQTFEKLQEREPEQLRSRFKVDHGLLLDMLQDDEGGARGYARLVDVIARSHEGDKEKSAHRRRAKVLFKSLHGADLVRVIKENGATRIVVNVDLQSDFSLLHTLSLWLVDALGYLDKSDDEYGLKVLSCVESVLESPRVILRQQLDRLKGEKVAEMKAAGIEYDERMAELEKMEHPKPEADFIYQTYNAFRERHPWASEENIRPKSIAREMFERYASFGEYIREYGLARSEGILLRYLSQTYKTLVQTVPESAKNEAVLDVEAYLRTELARTDTSLLEEWESLLAGGEEIVPETQVERPPVDTTTPPMGFLARVRAEMHAIVRALAFGDYEAAANAARQVEDDAWPADRFEEALKPFYEEYGRILFDPNARSAARTQIRNLAPGRYAVTQILVDDQDDNMWFLEGEIDLGEIQGLDDPWIAVRRVGS